MGPSITLKNVSLSIDGNRILSPLSARLEGGKVHFLIGPNGAGKTSLLKSMLGLLPHKGDIKRHHNGAVFRPVYIPQQPRFDQILPITVADYISAGLTQKPVFFGQSKALKEQVKTILDRVGLQGTQALSLGELSGGERQRLMFAQAISRESNLWFLDEPMTGLDAAGQLLITNLLLSLKQAGKTLIVVHHEMKFVTQYADNVLLIDGGLLQQGTTQEVNLHYSRGLVDAEGVH